VLWDKMTGTTVNNEFSEIIRMFGASSRQLGGIEGNLYLQSASAEIDAVNEVVYMANNFVYERRLESFLMSLLLARLETLYEWHRRIEARPAYVKAVVEWGDVTEEARRKHGTECFDRLEDFRNAAAG